MESFGWFESMTVALLALLVLLHVRCSLYTSSSDDFRAKCNHKDRFLVRGWLEYNFYWINKYTNWCFSPHYHTFTSYCRMCARCCCRAKSRFLLNKLFYWIKAYTFRARCNRNTHFGCSIIKEKCIVLQTSDLMSPKRCSPEEVIAANKRAKRVDDLYEQHGAAWITKWRKEREERRIADEQRLASEY